MNQPKFCFKKCQPINNQAIRVIGTFEILDDTIILPNEYNINGKVRVNKIKLIQIHDLDGNSVLYDKIESVSFSKCDIKSIFELGKITEIDNFDNQNILFSNGIHVFFNKRRAELYLLDKVYNGIYTWWKDDGIKLYEITYQNGQKHGLTAEFYSNGNLKRKAIYNSNILVDKEYFYNQNGKLINTIDHNIKFSINDGKYT